MIFGIYPGSASGTETGIITGKPDNPGLIKQALNDLVGITANFIVRGYIHYDGTDITSNEAPENVEQYISDNKKLDLVICYRSNSFNEVHWAETIKKIINRYGEKLYSLQITEEPNLKTAFAGDGHFDKIEEALLAGVVAAKQEIARLSLPVKIGFNTIPSFNPQDDFWKTIGSDNFKPLRDAIDYVGLDFFPDVFRAVAVENVDEAVIYVLKHYRDISLKEGNIPPSVPIHICENGWPTSADRSYEKQAIILEKIIRAICKVKDEMNITHYRLFSLRDTSSRNNDIFHQFGLMRDDYEPKPAFETYKNLIEELGE